MLSNKLLFLAVTFLVLLLLPLNVAAQDLTGRIIILDPGHGIGCSNLGYNNVFAGYCEQLTMLRLAHKIKPLFEARGATVLMTRETEQNVHVAVRAAMTNMWSLEVLRDARQREGADISEIDGLIDVMRRITNDFETYAPTYFNFPYDWDYQTRIHPTLRRIFELQAHPEIRDRILFVSLHSNAAPRPINTAVNGVDVYRMSNSHWMNRTYFTEYANECRTYLFGNLLLDNIHEIGIRRRGVRAGDWFVTRETNVPAVLVENGFHTNPQDRALLMCNDFLGRLALAYENAIVRYFAYIDPVPQVPPAPIHTIIVNGEPMQFRGFNFGGEYFFNLRDVAYAVNGSSGQFSVQWDCERNAVTITTGEYYAPVGGELELYGKPLCTATPNIAVVFINGQSVSFNSYNINGNNYFLLRELAAPLGFSLGWNTQAGSQSLQTR